MNIVRITSGLGNQIFQYAFYRALKNNVPDTKMDISEFKYRKHHYGYELERVFTIKPNYASRKDSNTLADVSKDWFSELRRKYFKITLKSTGRLLDEKILGTHFQPDLLTVENGYFKGFWQTEKYFMDIAEQLRNELTFKQTVDEQNKKIADEIMACNAVSIHIRRGDYIKKRRFESVGSVCSLNYYQLGINYIQSKTKQPRFFVFSDDINWAKENLKINNAYFVDVNTGKNSFKDMQLMSLCKHNIIANSSFSWWGAWLNANAQKIIIAPSIWFRNAPMPDIVPENWIKISVD
ncbi:MAG: alpha-1,2-fucosyltransferase [Bacteroidota bacterium]|nr:alpha-1,2-fucosyltransferase [Bacteroidota bacterium]